ncbi:hypothetical protein [Frigoriglobus tundricola]|nr:hypothetical protein [Frigoriglobus tundricola]
MRFQLRPAVLFGLVSGVALSVACSGAPGEKPYDRVPDAARAILEKADQLELLSLNPKNEPEDKRGKDTFHNYKILGQTTVKGDDRKALLAALLDGVKNSGSGSAACFNPRHGIRAVHDGKTTDLVICFECTNIVVYVGDKREQEVHTTRTPQKTFDKILTDAKVPLAP